MAQVTIKDIANQLNFSVSTVSRALHDHPNISDETKQVVQKLAKKLGYQPNFIAQSLQKMKTKTVGVVVPEIKHRFFSTVISGIEEVMNEAGYTIIVTQSNEQIEREVKNVETLISHQIAGLLVSVSQSTNNSDHFLTALRKDIQVIFFDRPLEDLQTSKVIVDDFSGAYQAVEHLIRRGYKRIGYLGGPKHLYINRKRLHGYLEAHKIHNCVVNEKFILYEGLQEQDGILGAKKFLQMDPKPDAVLCINDPVAMGVYTIMGQNGLNIPNDMAVVGFSDDPLSKMLVPPLTTVSQPAYDMGQKAARLLIEQINADKKEFTLRTITLNTKLILREST